MGLLEKKAREIHETRGGCIVCAHFTTTRPSWSDLTRHSFSKHLWAARALLVEAQLRKILPIASSSSEDKCRNMNATDAILGEAEELLAEISK